MKCAEIVREDSEDGGVRTTCNAEVLGDLRHCRQHATERLELARSEERLVLGRMKARAGLVLEMELRLEMLKLDQESDRQRILGYRREIEMYQLAGCKEPHRP